MATASASATPPPRGRPRSERARKAVLDAALALIEKDGYAATTIEAIATRSGVAKTTIYRWWPNRAALVVELLMQLAATLAPPARDDGPVRALRTEHGDVAQAIGSLPGKILGSLISEAQHDPELRDALLQGLFTPRRMATARVLREAQEARLIREDVHPLVAVDLLFGPLFYRGLLRQEPLTQVFVKELFEAAMGGLLEPARRRAPARSRRKSRNP